MRACDIAGGHAPRLTDRLEPLRLVERTVRIPGGLDVYGRDDVVSFGVVEIVSRQVVAPQRGDIAGTVGGGREPGMAVEAEVPQMMMRIDDGAVIDGHEDYPRCRRPVRRPPQEGTQNEARRIQT